jgi:hypothetical protein
MAGYLRIAVPLGLESYTSLLPDIPFFVMVVDIVYVVMGEVVVVLLTL